MAGGMLCEDDLAFLGHSRHPDSGRRRGVQMKGLMCCYEEGYVEGEYMYKGVT